MKELSIFVDESGDFGEYDYHSPYYIILMVLHDINLSARYADHIFAMSKGKLIAQGEPSKVISRELMKEIYGLDCQIIEDPVSGTPLIVPEGRYHKEAQNEKSFCA